MMDEDACATNLMVRDARMQELVKRETITPLIDRVRELLELGVSTILVTGGGDDYIDVADTVLLMQEYRARLVTETARRVAASHPTGRRIGEPDHPLRPTHRVPRSESFDARRRDGRVGIKTCSTDAIQFGRHELDLSAVEQLIDYGQVRTIAAMLAEVQSRCSDTATVRDLVHEIVRQAREDGLAAIESSHELALPRTLELAKALNRLRTLRILA